MTLSDIIINKIRNDGPVSFHDFMEMALYYPGLGYYTSTGIKIGKNGDYYTSPVVTSVFGEMIGKQIEEMWKCLGEQDFYIVEYGAGDGALCNDIMNQLKSNNNLYEKIHYYIVEKNSSPYLKKTNKGLNEKVSWHNSMNDMHEISGCILSNELIDNFPVHQIVMMNELQEVFVDYDNSFTEILKPASRELIDYLEQLKIILPFGFRTEINLQAINWIKEISRILSKGFVMTIDYGYPSAELYHPARNKGTLACYNNHQVNENLYHDIGKQDITAHVNFSALNYWGLKNGLECCGYTDQVNFLQSLGLVNHIRKLEENGKDNFGDNGKKAMLLYTFMIDMGKKLKVLIQQKGLSRQELSGLKLGRQFV